MQDYMDRTIGSLRKSIWKDWRKAEEDRKIKKILFQRILKREYYYRLVVTKDFFYFQFEL